VGPIAALSLWSIIAALVWYCDHGVQDYRRRLQRGRRLSGEVKKEIRVVEASVGLQAFF